jgi:hypothetical protein
VKDWLFGKGGGKKRGYRIKPGYSGESVGRFIRSKIESPTVRKTFSEFTDWNEENRVMDKYDDLFRRLT